MVPGRGRGRRGGVAGGSLIGNVVDTAAALGLLGLPAELYLTTQDEDVRMMLEQIGQRAVKIQDLMFKNLAAHIGKALSG